MSSGEDRRPPYAGVHPDGRYWAGDGESPEPDADEPIDHTVEGDQIKVMWDYGVRVPLWDDNGLMPDAPSWLRQALGLSDELIDDLTRWGLDMERLDAQPRLRTDAAYEALDARAKVLAQRLQQELGARYEVVYKSW